MARSRLFATLTRSIRTALTCEAEGLSTSEGLVRAKEEAARRSDLSRRTFLGVAGTTAGAAALAGCGLSVDGARGIGSALRSLDVGIVGAGLAGLACADELERRGIVPTLHEWSNRTGGRCWSMGGAFPGPVSFPGQVVERGGELVDNLHKTMLGYAQRFDLALEDVAKVDGEIAYHFDGRAYSEEAVVDEFRDLVAAMHDDLRLLSPPTADDFTTDDERLDRTTLAEWLDTRGAGPVIKKALDVAYNIEFGLETDEQSCLSLLLFMHADKRSRFLPFGIFSDERYHLVDGNEGIVRGLTGDLAAPIHLGRRLVRVAKLADGRIELTFAEGRRTIRVVHEAVVLTLPFSTLRDVELHASLGLPAWKLRAIRELRYGTNAKQMIGFGSRPWAAHG